MPRTQNFRQALAARNNSVPLFCLLRSPLDPQEIVRQQTLFLSGPQRGPLITAFRIPHSACRSFHY
jgi:hypothetical protein